MPEKKTGLAACDFIPEGGMIPYNQDPAKLKEWRNALGVSQQELAKEATVSKQLIAFIESYKRSFVEPSRTKIWDAIDRLAMAKARAMAAANPVPAEEVLSPFYMLRAMGAMPPRGKSPADDEQITKLWNEVQTLRAIFKRDQAEKAEKDKTIEALRATNETMRVAIENYNKLFDLKGAGVAGDALQEEIEQRIKKDKDA